MRESFWWAHFMPNILRNPISICNSSHKPDLYSLPYQTSLFSRYYCILNCPYKQDGNMAFLSQLIVLSLNKGWEFPWFLTDVGMSRLNQGKAIRRRTISLLSSFLPLCSEYALSVWSSSTFLWDIMLSFLGKMEISLLWYLYK